MEQDTIHFLPLYKHLRMQLIWTKVAWIAFAYLLGTFGPLAAPASGDLSRVLMFPQLLCLVRQVKTV